MNRLQLVQLTRQLAGIPGTAVTTIGQVNEAKRVVDWVDSAWTEIQRETNWNWLWEQATVAVTAGNWYVAGTIPASRYERDATYNGNTRLQYLPWADFREHWPTSWISEGTPTYWTVRPDMAFAVNAKVTVDTDFAVERYKNPTAMTADVDTPSMPSEHHEAIVYKALLLYANFEEAGVTRQTAEAEYRRHLTALRTLQLPEMRPGEPLL